MKMAVVEAKTGISDELQKELKKSMEKGLVRYCGMSSELSNEAVDVIISSIDKYQTNFEECAKQVKETMDKRFGATWHCIIGENYGFEVTHEQENLLYLFYQGNIAVLLFKC
mmetsp:Transcript_47902/g.79458  ORF Transcript_47902/g.79458 Transcript_47902/m.79458 type:complete len:112 (+) Transcript_47902:68-403(+)